MFLQKFKNLQNKVCEGAHSSFFLDVCGHMALQTIIPTRNMKLCIHYIHILFRT